jgi:hypothetical protein
MITTVESTIDGFILLNGSIKIKILEDNNEVTIEQHYDEDKYTQKEVDNIVSYFFTNVLQTIID